MDIFSYFETNLRMYVFRLQLRKLLQIKFVSKQDKLQNITCSKKV